MIEIVFSIYVIVASLLMFYQSYARLISTTLPYLSITGGSTESIILVVISNGALKWGMVLGIIGIVFVIMSTIARWKDDSIDTSATRMLILMTIIWTVVLFGCIL